MIAAALESHVREAARRGWALPTLAYGPDAARQAVVPGEALEVTDMWPYWLQARGGDDSTVLNSFSLSGLYLLTGPNMAGKSTVLRATTAVALLGSCGLSVPARAARIPYLDAFMLRNFSADSPLEGRSSFAVEMTEMRYVLEDASPRSLVCVDELGKGTEVRAGAALAGALVESLDAVGCKGIFATHLHALLDLPLDLRRTRRMRMEVAPAEQGAAFAWRPTLRMLPGTCTESLALDVARRQGLSQAVVDRASALYAMLEGRGRLGVGRGSEIGEGGELDRLELSDSTESNVSSLSDDGESGDASSHLAQDESRTLDAAGELLARTACQVLARLTDNREGASTEASKIQDDAPCVSAETGGQSELPPSAPATVCFVRAGQRPPPRTVGLSCVYVVRRIDGWFYVGALVTAVHMCSMADLVSNRCAHPLSKPLPRLHGLAAREDSGAQTAQRAEQGQGPPRRVCVRRPGRRGRRLELGQGDRGGGHPRHGGRGVSPALHGRLQATARAQLCFRGGGCVGGRGDG